MKAVFDHSEPRASNITSFFFKPEQPLQYTAGQYTRLTLDHPHADDRGTRRWFTLSSSPSEPIPFITTKFSDKIYEICPAGPKAKHFLEGKVCCTIL